VIQILLPAAIGAALTMVVVGFLLRARERTFAMNELMSLARYGEGELDDDEELPDLENPNFELSGFGNAAVSFAGRLVSQLDAQGSLAASLEKARIPLRAAEYSIVASCASIVGALLLGAITSRWILGVAAFAVFVFVAAKFPAFRIARRQKALGRQLPDALSLIASSLAAGHTFLRAIQMMCEEAEPPLAEEFGRVVFEVRLGAPLVDALERMAERSGLEDMVWVVQAIRIQQTVGGKLADLLHTLADFMRAREEVRREVDVLTAEGRISAWILGAMPVLLLVAVQVMSPGYANALFHGWGLAALAFTAVSIVMGVGVIRRMVRIDI
jgi:Flp pilus assembly protein TadB